MPRLSASTANACIYIELIFFLMLIFSGLELEIKQIVLVCFATILTWYSFLLSMSKEFYISRNTKVSHQHSNGEEAPPSTMDFVIYN